MTLQSGHAILLNGVVCAVMTMVMLRHRVASLRTIKVKIGVASPPGKNQELRFLQLTLVVSMNANMIDNGIDSWS